MHTYLAQEHPAIASLGLAEWVRWPHVQVVLGDRQRPGQAGTLPNAPAVASVRFAPASVVGRTSGVGRRRVYTKSSCLL